MVNLDGMTEIRETNEPKEMSDELLLLRWHVRLGHLPFSRLKLMALQGIIPKKLVKVDTRICLGESHSKSLEITIYTQFNQDGPCTRSWRRRQLGPNAIVDPRFHRTTQGYSHKSAIYRSHYILRTLL